MDERAEPIAIVGIGCRFPRASNPAEFWGLLSRGEDCVTEFPSDRFDAQRFYDPRPMEAGKSITKWGAFLDRPSGFDWRHFGISPREATSMDPQHRLLIETAWEALEDAGAPLESVAGSRTGVVCGLMLNDYRTVTRSTLAQIDGYTVAANLASFASNRISFLFDLRGASMTLDASCASSLVALHVACELIRSGELEGALVGAASLLLAPDAFISLSRASALSPTGRCRTFDANADGFVRGEGAGVVYLKRLSSALANADRIYAVIKGTATAHKGADHWIQEPNAASQEGVIREALRKAHVAPKDLDYVELHGTGTPRGDPVEALALGRAVSPGREGALRCLVGSVKTNIGHLDPAAGLAGLIKVALAIHHGAVPPSLHYEKPNPLIDAEALNLQVQTKLGPWPKDLRTAGVTSIGFGGVCAHAVLQSPPPSRPCQPENMPKRYVLPLSARAPRALRELSGRFAAFLGESDDPQRLYDACFTASIRRSHHDCRLCVVAEGADSIANALAAYSRGEAHPAVFVADPHASDDAASTAAAFAPGEEGASALAGLYCRGGQVDWSSTYPVGNVISIPTYRWQRETLWLDTPAVYGAMSEAASVAGKRHPFVGDSVEMAEPPGHVWAALLDGNEHAYLLDHRVNGVPVLPASAFIEVMLWAASSVGLQSAVELRDIRFKKAVLLSPGSAVRLSIEYRPSTALAGGEIRVFSKEATRWVENATCSVRMIAAGSSAARADVAHFESLFEAGPVMDQARCYESLAKRGLDFGAAFRRIDAAARHDGTVLAKVSSDVRPEGYLFHPAVQDACMHLLPLGLPERQGAGLMPTGIDRLRLERSPGPGRLWSRTEITDVSDGVRSRIRGRVEVFDASGDAVFCAEGVELARLASGAATTREALESWCYDIEWRDVDVAAARHEWHPQGTWIVWIDSAGFGCRLAMELASAGCRVIEVSDRPCSVPTTVPRVLLNWADLEDLGAKLQSLFDTVPDLAGFIYLGAIGAAPSDTQDLKRVDADTIAAWYPPLAIAQSLLRSATPDGKLWLVTSGVHSFGAAIQGALWGLGRSLVFDLSTHWGGLIDVDDVSDEAAIGAVLSAIALQTDSAEEILVSKGACRCARLTHRSQRPHADADAGELRLRSDALYLVIGGTGGLGLSAAERLVERGARHLVLVGRTPLPDREEWPRILDNAETDPRLRRQLSLILNFEARGVDTKVAQVDVARGEAFASFLDELRSTSGLPLRGIVHAAGVYDVLHIDAMTGAAFMRAMRPKCMPLFAIEQVVPAEELDFVVLFSSAASLISSPRLGHYAAANAFLDAFATRLRKKGVRALSLNWGLWADVGLIGKIGTQSSPARMQDVQSIPPHVGTDLFEHFLASDATQVLVWPTKWQDWARTYPSLTRVPLLSDHVGRSGVQGLRKTDGNLLERFSRSPEGERESIVRSFLRGQLEAALRLPIGEEEENRSLEDLGLDSLLAAEFATHVRAAFGVDLSVLGFLGEATLSSATSNVAKTLSTMYPLPDKADAVEHAVNF